MHQSALSSPPNHRRHASFIATRLAIASCVLGVAPFLLAFRGAPTRLEALVFGCSFAPLAAAVLAARTGRLVLAHGVAVLGLAALSLSFWMAGCGFGCAVAWLVAAQVEATLARDKRMIAWAGLLTAAVPLVILAVDQGDGALTPATAIVAGCTGLALVYALIVAVGSKAPDQPQSPHQSQGNESWTIVPEMLDDLVAALDTSGSVLRFPPHSVRRFGLPTHRLLGRGLFEHVHVADRPAFLTLIAQAAHGDAPSPVKLRLRTWCHRPDAPEPAHPKYIWVEMRARRPAPGAARASTEIVAILRDIDATYAHDTAMAAAQKAIEDAVGTRDNFLADMSHELRTPLNAIIGFSQMLASRNLRPADDEKQMDYARIVYQSGQHLLSIVNAVLDMSKIRSGTLAMMPEKFDITPLIDLCCDMVTLKADEGDVRIVRDCSAHIEDVVGDKRAVQQILINLLSNAVKFTPKRGQVTISARSDGAALHLSVSDTGIGIGPADLARLGDPFFQASSSDRPPFEGTGLGLSVVRGLVGLHGGTIEIESELGHGTRVDLRLPLDWRAAAPKTVPATIAKIEGRRGFDPALGRNDRRMKQIA